MLNDEIVNYIVDRINAGDDQYEIEDSLKRKEINPSEFDAIIEAAQGKILDYQLKIYPKQNKLRFAFWMILSAVFFILFFFILPRLNMVRNVTIISIIGSICLSFSLFSSFFHYGTWRKDYIKKAGRPKFPFDIYIIISLIPSLIIYFFISWSFSHTADAILKDTQEDAVATIIDGQSIEGRRLNFASVTVEFTTKDGKNVIAVEDVTTYKFKDFYKGQKLNIVYSRDNPQNIDLLTNESSLKRLKNKQARAIELNDLLSLTSVSFQNISSELNKINNNWVYDDSEGVWVDDEKQQMISMRKKPDQIVFVAGREYSEDVFPSKLLDMGFRTIDPSAFGIVPERNEVFYEREDYLISMKTVFKNYTAKSVVIISKK
jgi:hypothetical protein